jgi:F-box protein 30
VALALRDQRILNVWMNLPRKIQKLMRCNLTPRHPAIPLVLSLWEPSIKKKLKSISSEDGLSNVSTPRQSAERSDNSILSVSSAISTDDESPWGRRKKPPGLLQRVCALLSFFNELVDAAFADSGNSGLLPLNPPELPLLTTLGLDLSIIPRYQNTPKSMFTFICAQDFRRDEIAWHYRNSVM